MSKVAAEVAKAGKIAGQYFEKREKGLLYHADVLSHTDWLLCNSAASNKEEAATQQPSILLEGAIIQFTTTVLPIKPFLIQVCFHLMMTTHMSSPYRIQGEGLRPRNPTLAGNPW